MKNRIAICFLLLTAFFSLSTERALSQNLPYVHTFYSSFPYQTTELSTYISNGNANITNPIVLPTPYNANSIVSNNTPGPNVFNYVRVFEPQTPAYNIANVNLPSTSGGIDINSDPQYMKMQTQYYDGFGRNLQTIQRMYDYSSDQLKDVITPYEYRQRWNNTLFQLKYLPYSLISSGQPNGYTHFRNSPFTEQNNYYLNIFPTEGNGSSSTGLIETKDISDPHTRASISFPPGANTIGNGVGTTNVLSTNAFDEVIVWTLDPTNPSALPVNSGFYGPGTMVKKTVLDPDGGQVDQFYDINGQLICKRVLVGYTPCNIPSYMPAGSDSSSSDSSSTGNSSSDSSSYTPSYNLTIPANFSSSHPIQIDSSIPGNPDTIYASAMVYSLPSIINPPNPPPPPPPPPPNPPPTPIHVTTTLGGGTSTSGSMCPIYLMTYYVYDIYGRQVYTLHPKAVEALAGNSWQATTAIINELCDYVIYDAIGRKTATHKSGETDITTFVYDSHNRVVMTQIPLLRQNGEWQFALYDKLDRPTVTGVIPSTDNQGVWQSIADNDPAYATSNLNFNNLGFYFTQESAYPLVAGIDNLCQTYNYYDNYNYQVLDLYNLPNWPGTSYAYNSTVYNSYLVSSPTAMNLNVSQYKLQGKLTGKVTKVLQPNFTYSSLNSLEKFVYYYDDYGNLIQTQTLNDRNGIDIATNQYDFRRRLIMSQTYHNNPACSAKPYTNVVNYDQYNLYNFQLGSVTQTIDQNVNRPLSYYIYNDMGQPVHKIIGSIEDQIYEYNIRGQLAGINRNYAELGDENANANTAYSATFGESIKYDYDFTTHLYGGNISGIIWRGSGYFPKAYGYTYDLQGKLIQGDFRQLKRNFVFASASQPPPPPVWDNTFVDYTEGPISYDANGNINSIKRYGQALNTSTSVYGPTLIDDLLINYQNNSNKIQSISDVVPVTNTASITYDYKDRSNSTNEYSYDLNGNLTVNLDKTTTTTYYDILNKPKDIWFSGTSDWINYIYDADGNKLAENYNLSSGTTTYDYLGNFVYQSNDLYQILNQEGYMRLENGSYNYYFFVKDHLGNVRNTLQSYSVPFYPSQSYPAPLALTYFASHEIAAAYTENLIFENINAVRDDKPLAADTSDVKAAKLDAADSSRTIGTSIVLSVMAGDQFNLAVQSYFDSTTSVTQDVGPTQMMNAIISTLSGSPGLISTGEGGQTFNINNLFNAGNYVNVYDSIILANTDTTIPRAYLNYIFFDENFNIIPELSGVVQIGATAGQWNQIGLTNPITAKQNGYMTAYISNATAGAPVWFDHFTITHYVGALVEENHYYPYGLTVNLATSGSNQIQNRQLYQTQMYDKTDELYLYDFGARQYDPQLGRFLSLDPMNQFPSGYTGMGNDPVSTIDPTGMEDEDESGDDPNTSSPDNSNSNSTTVNTPTGTYTITYLGASGGIWNYQGDNSGGNTEYNDDESEGEGGGGGGVQREVDKYHYTEGTINADGHTTTIEGRTYDLNAFRDFSNKHSNVPANIMTWPGVAGAPSGIISLIGTKDWTLNGVPWKKHAEVSTNLILTAGNFVTLGKNIYDREHNLSHTGPPNRESSGQFSILHLHPGEGKLQWTQPSRYIDPSTSIEIQYGPSPQDRDSSPEGNSGIYDVIVAPTTIYIYNKSHTFEFKK